MKIVISSGHGKYIRGASGYLDEVDEARRVVESIAGLLERRGAEVITFHDNVSKTQDENLARIVDFHNSQGPHDLDISVHFNAYNTTDKPMGTECWYVTQQALADRVSAAIAEGGQFIDRGPKKTTGLYFLNNTAEPAILIEVCFVDSKADADLYHQHFDDICEHIADLYDAKPERLERPSSDWHENITATVFGMEGDEQEGAYGGWIDEDTVGVSFPYKWRDGPRPEIVVEGPNGKMLVGVVDVGPWNTDDPNYVLGHARPLAEAQYNKGHEAQNGRVPTNDAGIDLTEPVAQQIGIDGLGKVRWRLRED